MILKFEGDKGAVGQRVGDHIILRLVNGAAINSHGVMFAKYRRLQTDSGNKGIYQEIEFFLEDDNG